MYLDFHTHADEVPEGVFALRVIGTQDAGVWSPDLRAATAGIHPWYADLSRLDADLAWLDGLLCADNVWALGECGLDKLRGAALSVQEVVLEAQLHLALRREKPLVFHCVRAYEALEAVVRRAGAGELPRVIHGFDRHPQLMKDLCRRGYYLSFGAALWRDSSGAALAFAQCPPNRLFLETDAMGPAPGIQALYAHAAALRGCTADDLRAQVCANWKVLFGTRAETVCGH